jgi:hypothetical protein
MGIGLDDNIAMDGDAQRSWHGRWGSNGWLDHIYGERERERERERRRDTGGGVPRVAEAMFGVGWTAAWGSGRQRQAVGGGGLLAMLGFNMVFC